MSNWLVEFIWVNFALGSIAVIGLGIMAALGIDQGDGQLNDTMVLLRGTADWMVKLSIGAMVGYTSSRFVNGNGNAKQDPAPSNPDSPPK